MEPTMQDEQGLAVARMLVKAGVPMFLARPNPESKIGFDLPFGWETNEPDVSVVDAWRPGWALCAVTGHTFDLVDIDPRSGGDESLIQMPHIYLTAETPSGGRHHFVRTLGVSSLDGKVAAGIDVKSGTEDGVGRGFAFIAPTVRRSKVDGALGTYRWIVGPKGPVLPTPDQLAADGTGGMLRARVMELRRSSTSEQARRVPQSVAEREWETAVRRLATDVAHWQRHGWGGEAHSGILAATMHLARLDAERASEAFEWAFAQAGAAPDAQDWQKLHSAIERAVPDVVVPDAELSAAEAFFLGGDAPPSLGGSLAGRAGVDSLGAPMWSAAGSMSSATGEGRARFGALDEFEAESIPVPDPLIDGLLFQGTKARLSAPSGAGKTWVALDLAAHIANGKTWQGRDTQKTKVLYVAGEGAPTFAPRVRAWREYHKTPSGVLIEPRAVQIASEEWRDFIAFYSGQDVGLFIFDTLGSMAIGLKENDNDHANILHARLDMLVHATGAGILLIHHTGWEETGRPRGASAAFGGMDTELTLSAPGNGGLRDVTMYDAKQKHIERNKPMRLSFEKAHGGMVVVPKRDGSAGAAEGFFESHTRVAELMGHVTALEAFESANVSHSARHLLGVLRGDMGRTGSDSDLREVVRAFKVRAGVQGVSAPEWLAAAQNEVQASDLRGVISDQDHAAPTDMWA